MNSKWMTYFYYCTLEKVNCIHLKTFTYYNITLFTKCTTKYTKAYSNINNERRFVFLRCNIQDRRLVDYPLSDTVYGISKNDEDTSIFWLSSAYINIAFFAFPSFLL